MAAEVETGVYNIQRGVPWHSLGVPNEGFFVAAELLAAAGLDWTVDKQALYIIGADGSQVLVPDNYAVVRGTDGKPLGVVGNRYVPAQNAQVLAFMDELVGSGQALYDTAWSLRGGKTVAITAELNQHRGVLTGDEEVKTYITAANNHDGSGKIRLIVTPVRTVCMNTLAMATNAAKYTWERKHTMNWGSEANISEAREVLQLAQAYQSFIDATAAELIGQAFNKKSFEKLAGELLVADFDSKKHDEWTGQEQSKVEELLAVRVNSPNLANIRGTKWGALNAVAEWSDYSGRYRKTGTDVLDKRAESIMLGRGVDLKTRALELLRAA
jgi:phage/plasmid-like protein (TIGR03299 family)